uniref:Uncharacterized protein n=1 Tax=Sinocyclocheilus anshuiensis TaxID=1608454 RepID=A0A671KLK1_9TELE
MVQLEASIILVRAGESQLPCRGSSASVKMADMEFVEVFESPGKGRGLRATREVWAGDVLFAEPPFASVVFESTKPVIRVHFFKLRFMHHLKNAAQTVTLQ